MYIDGIDRYTFDSPGFFYRERGWSAFFRVVNLKAEQGFILS